MYRKIVRIRIIEVMIRFCIGFTRRKSANTAFRCSDGYMRNIITVNYCTNDNRSKDTTDIVGIIYIFVMSNICLMVYLFVIT